MKGNFLNIVIGIFIVAIGIICFLLFRNKEDTIVFKLNGDTIVKHNLGDSYNDPGCQLLINDEVMTSNVSVVNNVNVNKEGSYVVTYAYGDKVLKRTVEVKKINAIELNGDEHIYLLLNGEYTDPGVNAVYKEQDYSSNVIVDNQVDNSKTGDYVIKYTLSDINKSVERKVHVSEFDEYFKVDYDKTQSKDVTLMIKIDPDKVSKYILPDNTEKIADSSYIVRKNGNIKFTIYDKYNNKLEKTIKIDNVIVTPITATCKATVKDGKTSFTVNANKTIIKYVYNGEESTERTYTINKEIETNKVKLYDEDDQEVEITCTTKVENKKLEIHFIASGYYDDAILIRSPQATLFIDGGRGRDRVVNYLKALGVTHIDYLIGSHTEYDHIYTHSLIMRSIKVDRAIYPNNIRSCGCSCDNTDVGAVINAANATGTPTAVVGVPSTITIKDMNLYFIAPFSIGCNKNNNSFIFILQYGNTKFMFTGDADSALNNINKLQENARKLGLTNIHADIFKYPHHGNQMLGNTLITTIAPQAIIVPNYNAGSYGGPVAGVPAYRQSDSKTGNIVLVSDGKKVDIIMDATSKSYVK